MDYIFGGRAWGKTHAAVGWVKADPNRVLLVMTEQERTRIIRQYTMDPNQVRTWEVVRRDRGRMQERYCIDNIDSFIAWALMGGHVEIFTGPAGRVVMAGADEANAGAGFMRSRSRHPNMPTARAAGEPMADPIHGSPVTTEQALDTFTEQSLEDDIFHVWGEYGAHADVWREIRRRAAHDTMLFQNNITPERVERAEARTSQRQDEIIREALRNGAVDPREQTLELRDKIRQQGVEVTHLKGLVSHLNQEIRVLRKSNDQYRKDEATFNAMLLQRDSELASRERDAAGHHERIRLLSLRVDEQARLLGGLRNDLARAVGDVINTNEYQGIVAQLNEERQSHDVKTVALREAHRRIASLEDRLYRIRMESDHGGD